MDRDEIRWMREALRPGGLAVDVGAYKGGYTYWMRLAVGDAGRVLAFEPQPEAASMLRRYVAAFRWPNVDILEVALSSSAGERGLLRPGDGASPAASLVGASLPPGPRATPVRTDTLDRCLAQRAPGLRLELLKCDAEGHELEVFLGARDTLRDHRPAILFECEARHLPSGTVEDVFAHLHGLGYRGRFFWQGESVDVARFEARVHQVEGSRPYANNFIFLA